MSTSAAEPRPPLIVIYGDALSRRCQNSMAGMSYERRVGVTECEPIRINIGENGGCCERATFSARRVSGDRVDRTYSEGCCTRCYGPLSSPTRGFCYTTYRLGGARRTPATSSVSTMPRCPQSTYDDNSPREGLPTNCCNRLKRRYETL